MGAHEELLRLFEKASKSASHASSEADGGSEETRCLESIKAMHSVPVTTALLVSTQLGKKLRLLTKHSRPKIQKAASDLLVVWKKIVSTESKNGCTEAPLPSGEGSSMASPSAKVTKKAENVADVKVETKVKVEVSCADAKTIPKAKVEMQHTEASKASVVAKPVNSPNVAAIKDVKPLNLALIPKTKESTRDKIRELLAEAFARVSTEAEGDDLTCARSVDPIGVAVSVETVMFEKLGLSKGVNKMKYRSILFNIRDTNNPDFRRRVLFGDISPAELINLTPEDMASDQRKLENEEIKKKALFECERGQARQASTDQFKCGKCGQRKCTYFQLQTRSADEPMTTFVTCVNCNNRWKFC